jgi:Spy/CpxP family protein refolding chaperone
MQKFLVLVMLVACFAIAQSGAQAAPPSHSIMSDPNLFADAHLNGLDKQVHLSDKQKETIRPVFLSEGQKLIDILKDPSLSQDQRGQLIQQLHLQTASQVASMLTPEQQKNQQRVPAPGSRAHASGSSQI